MVWYYQTPGELSRAERPQNECRVSPPRDPPPGGRWGQVFSCRTQSDAREITGDSVARENSSSNSGVPSSSISSVRAPHSSTGWFP